MENGGRDHPEFQGQKDVGNDIFDSIEKGNIEKGELSPFDAPPAGLVFLSAIAAPTASGNMVLAPPDFGPTVIDRVDMTALGNLSMVQVLFDEMSSLRKNSMFEFIHSMVVPDKTTEALISYDFIASLAQIRLLILKAMCKLKMQKQFDVRIPTSTLEVIQRRALSVVTASTSTASAAPRPHPPQKRNWKTKKANLKTVAKAKAAPTPPLLRPGVPARHTQTARFPVEPMCSPPPHLIEAAQSDDLWTEEDLGAPEPCQRASIPASATPPDSLCLESLSDTHTHMEGDPVQELLRAAILLKATARSW